MLNNNSKKDHTNPVILEAINLHKEYPGKLVLNDINLRVSEGSFVSIVGPTGCGKSTFFRMILGSEEPTNGEILVKGKSVSEPGKDRGVVFQKYSLFPHLTVLQNVMLGKDFESFPLIWRWFNPDYYKKIRHFREESMHYLEKVGLADSAKKYPYELSGGMSQRAAIAQALIMKPSILLMDEPFGALDESTRQNMQIFLLDMWANPETNMTIFFVTHSIEEALQLGTRVIAFSQYYINEDGSPANGAKLVFDAPIPGESPRFQSFRYTSECNTMLEQITLDALDSKNRQK